MPVFTFMGSTILRQDDDFSFHVIVKTLQTIIPSLLKTGNTIAQIVSIMKMFVDAVRHIPEFRRLKLFKVLLEILNVDSYLGNMISLLLTYTLWNTTFSVGDKFDYNQFSMDLLHEYDGQVQLSTLNNIFQLLRSYGMEDDIFYSALFGDELDEKLSRKIHLRLVNFTLIALKSSSSFKAIQDVSMADSKLHMRLVENILSHIEIFANKGKSKFITAILDLLYETLHSCNLSLSLTLFFKVVSGLLSNSSQQIRKRTILMLDERVKAIKDTLNEIKSPEFENVLTNLVEIVSDQSNDLENIQLALLSISNMAINMGKQDIERYYLVLESLIGENGLLHYNEAVAATSLSTISTLVSKLKARMIPAIPCLMLNIFKVSKKAIHNYDLDDKKDSAEILIQSLILSLIAIIESVPLFITSYIPQIILLITNQRLHEIVILDQCLNELSCKLGTSVEHSSLFPFIVKSTHHSEVSNLSKLLQLLDTSIVVTSSSVILELRSQWQKFFLDLFDYRSFTMSSELVY
jgi:hypothetical protein